MLDLDEDIPDRRIGRYTLEDVVPACPSSNTSKCNDELTGWLRRKRLDERALLLRHVELRMALPLNVSAEGSSWPVHALHRVDHTRNTHY